MISDFYFFVARIRNIIIDFVEVVLGGIGMHDHLIYIGDVAKTLETPL